MKTIMWCCFAASVDDAMQESEEKTHKRRKTVWSRISFKITFPLGSAIFDVSI